MCTHERRNKYVHRPRETLQNPWTPDVSQTEETFDETIEIRIEHTEKAVLECFIRQEGFYKLCGAVQGALVVILKPMGQARSSGVQTTFVIGRILLFCKRPKRWITKEFGLRSSSGIGPVNHPLLTSSRVPYKCSGQFPGSQNCEWIQNPSPDIVGGLLQV